MAERERENNRTSDFRYFFVVRCCTIKKQFLLSRHFIIVGYVVTSCSLTESELLERNESIQVCKQQEDEEETTVAERSQ